MLNIPTATIVPAQACNLTNMVNVSTVEPHVVVQGLIRPVLAVQAPGQLDGSILPARDVRGASVRAPQETLAILARDPREAPPARDRRDPRDPSARDPREAVHARERERLAAAASTGRDDHRNVRRRDR